MRTEHINNTMTEWESLTDFANERYVHKHYQTALFFYRVALESLDLSGQQIEQDPEPTIAAMTLTYLNLAEVYCEMSDNETANAQYEQAIQMLLGLLKGQLLSTNTHHTILRACNRVSTEWANYINTHSQEMTNHCIKRYIQVKREVYETMNLFSLKLMH